MFLQLEVGYIAMELVYCNVGWSIVMCGSDFRGADSQEDWDALFDGRGDAEETGATDCVGTFD